MFETVSVDDVRRNALWHGVRAISPEGDWSFEGDAERGALFWQSGTGNDSLIAWCPDGVVGFAHDLYSYDDVEEESALAMLGEAPEALRELVTPLLARWVDRPTSALWIARDARHRVPAELTHGCTRGIELLDAYIADVPTDTLIDDLVERVLAGGGEIPDELLDLEGAGGEQGVDAVLERLGALGLRRA